MMRWTCVGALLVAARAQPGAQQPECTNQDALFGSGTDIKTTAFNVRRVITEDLDDDGDTDVLVAECDNGVVTWFDNGGGTPVAMTGVTVGYGDCPYEVEAADIDGDGVKDVVASTSTSIEWYKFNGEFPFEFTKNVLPFGYNGIVAVADLNGDGDNDILFASYDHSMVGWYENLGVAGDYNFTFHYVGYRTNPDDIEAADMDDDGDVDMIVASGAADLVEWYENLGGDPLSFRTHTIATHWNYPIDVEAVDIDLDGDMDVVFAAYNGQAVVWFENDGGSLPTFAEHLVYGGISEPRDLDVADFDNDGDPDLVLSSSAYLGFGDGEVYFTWYENNATANWFTSHSIGSLYYDGSSVINSFGYVAPGDLDGDGNVDVVATAWLHNLVRWYPNVCLPFTGPTPVPNVAPTAQPTSVPNPAPSAEPTAVPSEPPTTTEAPTIPPTTPAPTATMGPTTVPTPAPTGLRTCDDGVTDETIDFCRSYLDFCQDYLDKYAA